MLTLVRPELPAPPSDTLLRRRTERYLLRDEPPRHVADARARARLAHAGVRAGGEQLALDLVVERRADDEHAALGRRVLGVEGPQDAERVEVGHEQVEDDQVRLEVGDRLDGSRATVGLAEELHVVARLDGARHAGAEDEAVVDDENPERAAAPGGAAGRVAGRSSDPGHDAAASPRWPAGIVPFGRLARPARPPSRAGARHPRDRP